MKTYVLIQAEPTADVARLVGELARLPGVDWTERVRGPFDVIAEVSDDVDLPAITAIGGVLRALASPVVAPARSPDARDQPGPRPGRLPLAEPRA